LFEFKKKSIPTRWKVIGNSWGEGVLTAKILEAKYEAKLEFPGGGGCKTKNLPWGEYNYFLVVGGEHGYFLEQHNKWHIL